MRMLSASYTASKISVTPERPNRLPAAEEILSTKEYTRTIKANDRATMLNLMIGLNGYTLCSGIICEELNGDDYLAIPFEEDSVEENSGMEIGYITRQNTILSSIGKLYIDEIRKYLGIIEL